MTIIQQSTVLNRPITELYTFLADLCNHEQLMPENIQDWSSTPDEAHFTIQNMAQLSLKVEQRLENERIKLIPVGKAPFDITLTWQLSRSSDSQVNVALVVEAQLNMMMKMVATAPLQKLVDFQVRKLSEIFV